MKKICVIFGGKSCEHDISIITGLQLCKNLRAKYDLEKIYMGLDNRFYLATKINSLSQFADKSSLKLKELIVSNNALYLKGFSLKKYCDIECVINCCHGGVGENGDLAGFFVVNNVRCTSARTLSAHIAMDKSLSKELLQQDIPVVKSVLIKRENLSQGIEKVNRTFSENLVVKPNSLGSSIGVKVCTKSNFQDQVSAIFEMNDDALVEEQIIDMEEYNQACFSSQEGLVLSEIERPLSCHEVLTFDDKYLSRTKTKGASREMPANISAELAAKISDCTAMVYKKLNLSGVVRVDYIYDRQHQILYFNEVNTIPGSMAFYLFEGKGIDYITLIEQIISNSPEVKNFSYFDTHVLTKNLI